jgi:hypothetical protein
MEDDLKRTIRRMQDNAERHTRRLLMPKSTDRQVGVSSVSYSYLSSILYSSRLVARPRPFPLDEPPAKRARVQEPAGSGARVLTECEQQVRIPTELGAPPNPFNTTISSSTVTSTQSAIITDTSSTSPSVKSEILPQTSSSSSNVKASAPQTAVRRVRPLHPLMIFFRHQQFHRAPGQPRIRKVLLLQAAAKPSTQSRRKLSFSLNSKISSQMLDSIDTRVQPLRSV